MSESAESVEGTTSEVSDATTSDAPLRSPEGEEALRRERTARKSIERQLAKLGFDVTQDAEGKVSVSQKNKPSSAAPEDSESMRRSIQEEVERQYAPVQAALLRTTATNVLLEAGLNTNVLSASDAARLLDLDEVTVDGGKVDMEELQDRVAALKEKTPRLFKVARTEETDDEPRKARGPKGSADIGKQKSAGISKTSAERLVESYFGSRKR